MLLASKLYLQIRAEGDDGFDLNQYPRGQSGVQCLDESPMAAWEIIMHHTVLRQDILDELTFTLRIDANDIGFAVETGIVDP